MNPRIYLDYAASTPVDPRVISAMSPYFAEKFGNPGSVHSFGQAAISAIDKSRETIAKHLGADFRQVIFTASATEANNLVLRSAATIARSESLKNPKIIISCIEHESILETACALEKEGVEVVYLPADSSGIVDVDKLKTELNGRTVLVSIMSANNEVGTIQPIAEVAKIIETFRSSKIPLFHVDAAQAFQFLECTTGAGDGPKIDFMTISSHKMYGPKGSGALFARDPKLITPQLEGGGQEFGLRSGTENVPAIVGFAKAVELIAVSRQEENKRITGLRDELWDGIRKITKDVELNGTQKERLPNILNVYFPGHDAQDLLTQFDLRGLAASSGSACRSRAIEPSYVLRAMGFSQERAKSSVRFSLGRPTTKDEISRALGVIRETFFQKKS